MTVRTRLHLTFVGVTLLLVLPALYGVSRLAELRDIAFEQRGRHAAAFLALGRLQAALAELDRFQRSYIAARDPVLRQGVRRALADARVQLARLSEAGYADAVRGVSLRLDSLENATRRIESLVESGRVEEATAFFERVKPLLAGTQEQLDAVARTIDQRSLADLAQAQQISTAAVSTTLLAVFGSLVLALALGIWSTSAITAPLLRLRQATATVAAGEFVAPPDLPYQRSDEIGDLSRSFRAMTRRLAELDRIRAEFMGIATHDLKTPINAIAGYAELLEEGVYGELNEKQREAVETIHEQTVVLTRLANQILDVSRLETGRLKIEPKEIEPAEILSAVERAFRPLAEQSRIDFAVEIDPSLPPKITVDPDRLRDQVLGNLLSNAFKFTPEGERIRLRAWRADETIRIDVSDTGPGIPQDQLPHIFEMYYQVGKEARAMGSGLGLAIARAVVEAHGGQISAESEPGRGTTFHIRLPITPQGGEGG